MDRHAPKPLPSEEEVQEEQILDERPPHSPLYDPFKDEHVYM